VLTKVKQHNNQKNFRIFSNNEAKKIISKNNNTSFDTRTLIIIIYNTQINQKAKIKQPTTVHQRVFTSVKFFICPNCRYTSRTLFSGHTNLFLLFLSSPPRKKEHTTQVPGYLCTLLKKPALSFLCYK